jgi:hypothetical protein
VEALGAIPNASRHYGVKKFMGIVETNKYFFIMTMKASHPHLSQCGFDPFYMLLIFLAGARVREPFKHEI